MGLLDDKVTVITGAGSGMGRASVGVFVREGASVVAGDVSGAEQATAAEFGDAVLPVHCDVTSEADVENLFRAARERFGRVDVVLNVAGIGRPKAIHEFEAADYDSVMDVNLRGVLHGMKHGIRAFLDQGTPGAIVNWSSVGGLNSSAFATPIYSASKAGVISVTKNGAVNYGAAGIRVNAICPGFILSEMMGAAGAEQFPEMFTKASLGRAGQPAEVAEVAAFLASDRASFLTGAIIPVDGGWAAKLA